MVSIQLAHERQKHTEMLSDFYDFSTKNFSFGQQLLLFIS